MRREMKKQTPFIINEALSFSACTRRIQQRSEAAHPATALRRFGPAAQCIDFSLSGDTKYDCNGLETQNIDFWWSRNTKYLFVVVWRHKQFVSSGLETRNIDF